MVRLRLVFVLMITFPVRIGLRHDRLDLGDGNRGEEFHEKNKVVKNNPNEPMKVIMSKMVGE